ncbi:LapA family protein [Oryzomicrobium sp.]|uniref:LapA family protein n=1 Tax=Oryzomicrobium sp. TaxID=1911578 RepID=UPI0025D961C2|nr:LapA family protein [Oryzomicrobium sp.]MCE1243373.1 LapA family protein [Oryzomicrobium sp.]
MRIALWLFRFAVFILLLGFAIKNTEPAQLKFFFGTAWNAPLIMLLLAFFVAGVVIGMVALVGVLFGLKRENGQLRRQIARSTGPAADAAAPVMPPREL